jgi:hypothetical protein
MALPFLPICLGDATGTNAVDTTLRDADLVGTIVEQVRTNNIPEAIRLAVYWCSLNRERRAHCDANSGTVWRQLTTVVFPNARAPTPADAAHGYKPKDAQSAGKAWFYYLCMQFQKTRDCKEELGFALVRRTWENYSDWWTPLPNLPHDLPYDVNAEWTDAKLWKFREDFLSSARNYTSQNDLPQAAIELVMANWRRNIPHHLRTIQNQRRSGLYLMSAIYRFQAQIDYMADLFQDPNRPQPNSQLARAYEAYATLRKELLAQLHTPAYIGLEQKMWEQRKAFVKRKLADNGNDNDDPREANLQALIRRASAKLDLTPAEAMRMADANPRLTQMRAYLYAVKYLVYKGMGRGFVKDEDKMPRQMAALERALDALD